MIQNTSVLGKTYKLHSLYLSAFFVLTLKTGYSLFFSCGFQKVKNLIIFYHKIVHVMNCLISFRLSVLKYCLIRIKPFLSHISLHVLIPVKQKWTSWSKKLVTDEETIFKLSTVSCGIHGKEKKSKVSESAWLLWVNIFYTFLCVLSK